MVDKEPKIIHFPGLDQEDTSAPAGKQAAKPWMMAGYEKRKVCR